MPHLNRCFGLRKGESTALSSLKAVIDQDARDRSGAVKSSVRDEETEEGDECNFVLISSDGVPFKIQRYHLMSHSPVFRDMMTISSEMGSKGGSKDKSKNNEIQLCDEDTETFEVVSMFCKLISGEPLKHPEEDTDLANLICVHPFLVKYEAGQAMERLKLNLHKWAQGHPDIGISSSAFFFSGSFMDDLDLMVSVLKGEDRWYYTQPGQKGDNTKGGYDLDEFLSSPECGGVVGTDVLNIGSMHYKIFCSIKDKYKFALLRSLNSVEGGPSSKKDWEIVGDKFREIVVEVEKYDGLGR
ncbi:hypothetical protein I302_102762 [Kwoniella bestiolae CBS 10118]|uniref:BTB domain-containing protein n=1 Tax=Kwoniella bestiolae CBS 10118 TaxID=1296100 RepID=A0A1B9GFW1_9TREE|nr:hypothetical protein I302_01455 [Kwoniella bestiolae CBS 10118]OCF29942.1 hypothetical protein I302_01455 [Kwoniella bestiolae CBS 10118]